MPDLWSISLISWCLGCVLSQVAEYEYGKISLIKVKNEISLKKVENR
jgi:hypothetical protein